MVPPWQERIVVDPSVLAGKPVVKGTRLAVEFLLDLLAQGWSEADLLDNYPGLTHDDLRACFGYHPKFIPPGDASGPHQQLSADPRGTQAN